MNQTLGICIPTYKRPDQLGKCVESVIAAAAPFQVPIFIADDSTDTTNREIIEQLSSQYTHIFVAVNKENLGIDGNILHSVNICTCSYAWLLGEDDRLHINAIETVLSILEKSLPARPPFILVNYASVDSDIKIYLKEHVLALDHDIIESAEDFLVKHSWAAGFIGGCVVEKNRWNSVAQQKYIGTYFAHVGVILEMIRDQHVHVLSRPLVLNRCGEPRLFTWSDSTFKVAGGWKKMIDQLCAAYSPEPCRQAIRQFEKAHGLYSYRFLCYARADYAYRLQHYRLYLKPLRHDAWYRLIALCIACTPPQLLKAVRFLVTFYRRLRNPPVVTR